MDISTTYMGMQLEHPIVPSASPLSYDIDGIRRLEDAGASAIVMFSLFEEQIATGDDRVDDYLSTDESQKHTARDYYPAPASFNATPDEYLTLLTRAKASAKIPIIGSLNGVSRGGWIRYARAIEEAGADALEINLFYLPTDKLMIARDIEDAYVNVLREVKSQVGIPIALKLSPYFTSLANLSARLERGGADALVLFNRFQQPDFDPERCETAKHISLSTSDEMRLPLHWTALLYGATSMDLAITTGVHTHLDVLKGLMAGASVTMMASELLRNGTKRIGEVVRELKVWMEDHSVETIDELRGTMSYFDIAVPPAMERANYIKILQSWRAKPNGLN